MRKQRLFISVALIALAVIGGLVYSVYSLKKAKADLALVEDEKHGLHRRVEQLERDKTRLTRQYEESEKARWKVEQDLKRARRSDSDMLPLSVNAVPAAATQPQNPVPSPVKETVAPVKR